MGYFSDILDNTYRLKITQSESPRKVTPEDFYEVASSKYFIRRIKQGTYIFKNFTGYTDMQPRLMITQRTQENEKIYLSFKN